MEDKTMIAIGLGLLGLVLGSFAGATVWRLRARQLQQEVAAGEKVRRSEKQEIAKLRNDSPLRDRSVCLHCGHTLEWYDLIPLFSWASLGGKCRYCRTRIGYFEPLMEIGLAVFFVASFIFWPMPLTTLFDITQFVIWLVAGLGLIILFAYDAKWFLLPNVIVFPLIGLGIINALIVLAEGEFAWPVLFSILMSAAILSGLYYLIYVFSAHRWVGFGDVKLGLALALLLADWQLAILALFLSNFIGTLILLPFILTGKVERQSHIPFGPLLIAGWAITGLFGAQLLTWYMSFTLGV